MISKLSFKTKFIVFILIFISQNFIILGQESNIWKNGNGFKSVFQEIDSGNFVGTVNGVLFVRNSAGKDINIDFQGSNSTLEIIKDDEEVYDVSTKKYIGKSTSGLSEIEYKTYGLANSFVIKTKEGIFEFSLIDGGCDMIINGLDYFYKAEKSTEFLVLNVSKEIYLYNWENIRKNNRPIDIEKIKESTEKNNYLVMLPHSSIVFAINRK
jgi:hypothetical protein